MKRTLYFVMALALVLGFTQCKKEQIEPQSESNDVHITLDLKKGGSNGSRVEVDPPHVTFEEGDQILVGYNNAYVGTLIHNGTRFEGNIDATVTGTQKLYFYFVGNKNKTGAEISVGDNTYTVDISDQMEELPVLSFSASNEDFVGEGSYTAVLQNQCALVKFTTASTTAPVHVGGLFTEAQINFASPGITPTNTKGFVNLYPDADDNTAKWAVLLPQTISIGTEAVVADKGYTISISEPITISADDFITGENAISISTPSNIVYLDWLTTDYKATNGQTLKGTLNAVNNEAQRVKISIAAGATVTLDGVTINGVNEEDPETWEPLYKWAGITCLGNATIILKDGTENIVRGFYEDYPGISIPENRTLTIKGGAAGTGKLTASPYDGGGTGYSYGAGIGGGYLKHCGNIEIQGGDINATGGSYAAGIGGGDSANCGTITISGGTVTATGGEGAAGIGGSSGSSDSANCGTITISGGTVTATGGDYAPGIGSGFSASCDAITISGGTVTATGGEGAAGIGGGESANCGDITITTGVTSVTATKGKDADISIGVGDEGTCGKVTIGGVETGFITESPYTYEP